MGVAVSAGVGAAAVGGSVVTGAAVSGAAVSAVSPAAVVSGEFPEGRSDRLSPSQRAEIAVAFCETARNSGYQPGVYAGQNFLKAFIDYSVISRYTVWLASYTSDNQLPFFDKRYDLWQFTDWGRVDGIRGVVDLNVIF